MSNELVQRIKDQAQFQGNSRGSSIGQAKRVAWDKAHSPKG